MVSVSEVIDPLLREPLEEAESALDDGDYATSVRRCVAAYACLIERRPDMIIAPRVPGSAAGGAGGGGLGGVGQGAPRPWPSDHGVRFALEDDGKPTLTVAKERFTLSEAATYFEYTLDMVVRAQRRPPAASNSPG
jgi:hypothetical protein